MSKPLLPATVREFDSERERFVAWLSNHGAEVRKPTNEYEVIRFTTPQGIGIVYRNRSHKISGWSYEADSAWIAFKTGDDSWRVGRKQKRVKLTQHQATIIERDGDECWYCGKPFGEGEMQITTEHMVSLIHKGPNHLSNLVVAHQSCNLAAGNLSVAEKVRLREQLRSAP
jgi:hypothetical protein